VKDQQQRSVLILDLDGTILHSDAAEGAIVIQGRTSSSHLAPQTLQLLQLLSIECDIVLATGRAWRGTQTVVQAFRQYGIQVMGIVLEDGGLYGDETTFHPLDNQHCWATLWEKIDRACDHIGVEYSWQTDYVSCLAITMEHASDAARMEKPLLKLAQQYAPELRSHLDGRKIFLLGEQVNKWHALKTLLGPRAEASFGVGDGLNDVPWLSQIALPCTLPECHPQVCDLVQTAGGKIASNTQHAGIAEILAFLYTVVGNRGQMSRE
jgi:hydroxymethylpyrimidine pyrophosphatase-like HAD family hydrolase